MAYRIRPGIKESELSAWLKNALEKYGPYKDGGVDYTKADLAPIVMCTAYCNGKILILKRADNVGDAAGFWSVINGFIDEDKPVKEIACKEAREELGLEIPITSIKVGKSYTVKNDLEIRSYIVFPCLVVLETKPDIKLDHEHTDFGWIDRSELDNYHILEDLHKAVDSALALL